MTTTTIKVAAIAAAIAASIAVGTTTAAAASPRVEHYRFTGPPTSSVYEPCGAVETVTVSERGSVHYDGEGEWVRTRAHFSYDSRVTGPSGSIRLDAHQSFQITAAGILTLTGQGANVRAPGAGLLYQDVGRLVVDTTSPFPGETLFASAKAVSFEAFDPGRLAAAICAAVG
jgi:hypothetical protein